MPEPTLAHTPVLTVTQRQDGWAVLVNGEPNITGLYTREAAETVVETWAQYEPPTAALHLTDQERKVAARAVHFMASFTAALDDEIDADPTMVELAHKIAPDGFRV